MAEGLVDAIAEVPTTSADGRVQRKVRTRARIIDACRNRMLEGDHRPTHWVISGGAGVSSRSVFQHFGTLEAVYLAALDDAAVAAKVAGEAAGLSSRDLAALIVLGRRPE